MTNTKRTRSTSTTVAPAKATPAKGTETVVSPEMLARVETVATAVRDAEKGKGHALYLAALTYAEAVGTGIMSQGDYADRVFGHRDAEGQPVKRSGNGSSTLVKRLSDAAVRLGVEEGSDVWRYLVQRGQTKAAGEALAETRKASALKALRLRTAEWLAGNAAPSNAAPSNAAPKAKSPASEQGEAPKVTAPVTSGDVLATLRDVFSAVKNLSADEWSKVETAMTAGVANEVARRVTLAAKEAKGEKIPA